MSDDLIALIRELAVRTKANVGNVRWYWFGSAREGWSDVADIDLLVVCESHTVADRVRRFVDLDQLSRPIHLSILTKDEEHEVNFVERQGCAQIA